MEQKKGVYRWLVLGVLVLSFTSTFLSRFIWSPVLSVAAEDLGFSMLQAGNLMSAFYFGYLFTQIPGGFLADRFRVKFLMFACVAGVGLLTFAMAMVNSYAVAYAVRFAGGLFGGAIMAFCSRLLSNYFAPRERGVAFGILLASPSIGTLLANQVAPQALSGGTWRTAFQVTAIIIGVIAVLVLVVIREPKREATAAGAPKAGFIAGLKNYFTNPQILILSLAGFLFMAIPAGYSTWANKFITGPAPGGLGLTAMQAGIVLTVYSVFSIVGSMSSGVLGKKFGINPKYFVMAVYVLMAGSILLFGMQTSYTGLLITSAVFGLFSCMSSTHITSWAVNIGGNQYAATTTSIQNLLFQSANVIFPTVAGSIIDRNTEGGVVTDFMGVWILYAILLGAAFVVMLFTSKKSAAESMK